MDSVAPSDTGRFERPSSSPEDASDVSLTLRCMKERPTEARSGLLNLSDPESFVPSDAESLPALLTKLCPAMARRREERDALTRSPSDPDMELLRIFVRAALLKI